MACCTIGDIPAAQSVMIKKESTLQSTHICHIVTWVCLPDVMLSFQTITYFVRSCPSVRTCKQQYFLLLLMNASQCDCGRRAKHMANVKDKTTAQRRANHKAGARRHCVTPATKSQSSTANKVCSWGHGAAGTVSQEHLATPKQVAAQRAPWERPCRQATAAPIRALRYARKGEER
jgi:hypothetical protein